MRNRSEELKESNKLVILINCSEKRHGRARKWTYFNKRRWETMAAVIWRRSLQDLKNNGYGWTAGIVFHLIVYSCFGRLVSGDLNLQLSFFFFSLYHKFNNVCSYRPQYFESSEKMETAMPLLRSRRDNPYFVDRHALAKLNLSHYAQKCTHENKEPSKKYLSLYEMYII